MPFKKIHIYMWLSLKWKFSN